YPRQQSGTDAKIDTKTETKTGTKTSAFKNHTAILFVHWACLQNWRCRRGAILPAQEWPGQSTRAHEKVLLGGSQGGKMVGPLRAIARFCEKKIGWNRIGVLLSLTIIAVAADVLFHSLRNLDVDAVIAALKATEYIDVAAAAL